jgi:hypothetical protein
MAGDGSLSWPQLIERRWEVLVNPERLMPAIESAAVDEAMRRAMDR